MNPHNHTHRRHTTADRCHCNAPFDGSDHCPFCGCEQYERYCNADADGDWPATKSWLPGEVPQRRYITH